MKIKAKWHGYILMIGWGLILILCRQPQIGGILHGSVFWLSLLGWGVLVWCFFKFTGSFEDVDHE